VNLRHNEILDEAMMATIGQLVGSREGMVRRLGITQRTMSSFVEEFGRMPRTHAGFAFPVYCWFLRDKESDVEVAIIDRGAVQVRILIKAPPGANPMVSY
jgi:hypothetical protein